MGSWVGDMMERTNNAIRIGQLEGQVEGYWEAIQSWRKLANELGNKVDYFRALASAYRGDAISGWGRASAYKKIAQEAGVDFNDPEIQEKLEKLTQQGEKDKELIKTIDEFVKKSVSSKTNH